MSTVTVKKQILVAAVGNLWLRDDGFGSRGREAAAASASSRPASRVVDFGTGGLDLAYEVMRGYDALVLVDVSRQGGEPGTLYVMEVDQDSVGGAIEDGDVIDPHGMDPQTVLRFVKAVGGWPGKVVVVACEPEQVEEMGIGLCAPVAAAVDRAVDARRGDRRGAASGGYARALARTGDRRHRGAPRGRPAGYRRRVAGRGAAPGRPRLARVLLRVRRARHRLRGRAPGARARAGRLRCRACGGEWELERPPFRCPTCGGGRRRGRRRRRVPESSRSNVEEEACIAHT